MRERILELIKKEELTPSQFADAIGIQRSALSHIISGRNNVSLDVIMKIHQQFPKVSLQWLLDGIGSYEPTLSSSLKEEENKQSVNTPSTDTIPPYYQSELFAENTIFSPAGQESSKNRKDLGVEKPQMVPKQDAFQSVRYIEKPVRKVIEIKLFYDDGTYESFDKTK